MNKKILLYYKYTSLSNLPDIQNWQRQLCTSLELTGRIILATEGINGTVCGTVEATDNYIAAMNSHDLFSGIDFKESTVNGAYDYFPKLHVSIKPEITHLGIQPEKLLAQHGGTHLTPQKAHELMQEAPHDLIILDGRNHYEARVGAFKNAITPPIHHFREFPNYIDENLETFKDKRVLMYCTGGIRCERASAYLKTKNVAKEVLQIEGGIHRYAEQYPDGFFRGKNYVFDARVTVPINDDVLATCDICNTSCDNFTNCRNAKCNKQFICCPSCFEKTYNCCSTTCLDLIQQGLVNERPYRPKVDPKIT